MMVLPDVLSREGDLRTDGLMVGVGRACMARFSSPKTLKNFNQ